MVGVRARSCGRRACCSRLRRGGMYYQQGLRAYADNRQARRGVSFGTIRAEHVGRSQDRRRRRLAAALSVDKRREDQKLVGRHLHAGGRCASRGRGQRRGEREGSGRERGPDRRRVSGAPALGTNRQAGYATGRRNQGAGAWIYGLPSSAARIRLWPDGTAMEVVGGSLIGDGITWQKGNGPAGNVGGVDVTYLVAPPATPTPRFASTPTRAATAPPTHTPTPTPTDTPTLMATYTPTPTPTYTPTPIPTDTPAAIPTSASTPSATPELTAPPTATSSPSPTATSVPDVRDTPTALAAGTAVPESSYALRVRGVSGHARAELLNRLPRSVRRRPSAARFHC